MLRRKFLSSVAAILSGLFTGCETQPHHVGVGAGGRHYDLRVVFSDQDKALIRDYFRPRHPHGLPPGLAKKDKIPPGHAMKLRRGDAMPHGQPWNPLPRDLEDRLSRLPDGYVRVVVCADIGILDMRSRVILDVLEDIAD